jgi:hypothetical protein
MFVSCTVFVLSGRGLCDGPIPRTEESYRLWCASECDQMKINKNFNTCCEQVGRRSEDYVRRLYTLGKILMYLQFLMMANKRADNLSDYEHM